MNFLIGGKKRYQGLALIWVLLLVLVTSTLITSVFFIMNQNHKESIIQSESIQAHYLALSGIEIAYAYLIAEDPQITNKPVLNRFLVNEDKEIEQTHAIKDEGREIGHFDLKIYRQDEENKKFVIVESVGYLKNSSVKSTSFMKINLENPIEIITN